MQRIKKNDQVKIISGKDTGREGRVVRVYRDTDKILVEGVNVATKHERITRTRRGAQEGGITHVERPIDASNAMPICPKTDEPTRVAYKAVDGKRVRISKKSGEEF